MQQAAHPHPRSVLCKLIGRAAPRRTTRQTASLSLVAPTPASPPEPSVPCGQHCTAAACRCQPGAAGAPRNEARRWPLPPTETPPPPALAGGGQAAQQENREACHGAGNQSHTDDGARALATQRAGCFAAGCSSTKHSTVSTGWPAGMSMSRSRHDVRPCRPLTLTLTRADSACSCGVPSKRKPPLAGLKGSGLQPTRQSTAARQRQ